VSPRTLVARALDDGNVELPVLPKVANDVMLAAQDPLRGSADVARHIERDPALCATVLRSANSAIYGGSVEMVSARQAVARLGMVEVASLAMTAAVRAAVTSSGLYQAHLAAWWRESLATGLFAKEIARARRCAVDSAFLCGLFRRVGVPVVLRVLERRRADDDAGPGADEIAALLDEFAVPAGVLLCDSWKLSAAVRASVLYGNGGSGVGDIPSAFADHVFTAALGGALARALAQGTLDGAPAPSALSEALNLYPDDLERIVATAPAIASSVENMA
jgi:HD-like signal output (HDOD) protein